MGSHIRRATAVEATISSAWLTVHVGFYLWGVRSLIGGTRPANIDPKEGGVTLFISAMG